MPNLDRELVESVERRALEDLAAAARERGGALFAEQSGGALLLQAPGVHNPLLNRVVGLGFRRETTRDEVDAIVSRFEREGTSRYFVHLYDDPTPAELPGWLASRGIVRYARSWNKLARGRHAPVPRVSTELTIRAALPGEADALAEVFAEGFDLPEAAALFYTAVIGRSDWHVLVATRAERVVAGGLLFMADGVGYLAGGATASRARCQGAQLALIAERSRIALDQGCSWIVSETGEAVPGDPQHSHSNLERCGLRVIATRHNYAPSGTSWRHGPRA